MKKIIALLTCTVMLLSCFGCSSKQKYERYANMTPEKIVSKLTLEQKAAQMVQPVVYAGIDAEKMKESCYGSIYGDMGGIEAAAWRELVDGYQKEAIASDAGIPYLYAQDDVHGVGYCIDAVYFPQNIGQGAANDEELAYQVGLITADEAKLCHMLWNLYPCVAQSTDPRWGRTYESYSSDLETIKKLSTAYTKGLIDGGVLACAKHYFGDGNTVYGTGENSDMSRLIDRGDSVLTDQEIDELISVYQAQIDAGVQTIMVSYTSLNGLKMHENGDYIWKLKNEMGFEGFIVSDYDGIHQTSPEPFEEKVIIAVNSGIDMFMVSDKFEDTKNAIIQGVKDGKITKDRIDDAVTRIIRVKQNMGLFEDPLCENLSTVQQETGSADYRAVAEKLVEKSLVLVKNEDNVLPLKQGAKVYITGPAADNARAQCGGWTIGWVESPSKMISGVTTIKKAFETYANDYGIEIITDPERAEEADVVLLCVGEKSYAEGYGDTPDLELCGKCGLEGNRDAIDSVKALNKPTVTCIIAGRNVILDENDYNSWDSVVMCYLPGSEGKGISDVLCGCSDFSGKLPSPWYGSVDQILTDECFFEMGYGLTYPEGFVPSSEPSPVNSGEVLEKTDLGNLEGKVEGNVYSNDAIGIKINIPEGYTTSSDQEKTMMQGTFQNFGAFDNAIDSSDGSEDILIYYFDSDKVEHEGDECTPEDCFNAITGVSGAKIEVISSEKVTICGKDFTKYVTNITSQGSTLEVQFCFRKIDDKTFACLEFDDYTGEKGYDHFLEWFTD